jgi:DNA-binding LacI/PurR family transcriptional regulator
MLYGIELALHPEYFVAVASLPAFDRDSLSDAVDRFVGQAVAGILVIVPDAKAADALRGLTVSIPIVVVGTGEYAPLPSVSIDNRVGAMRATQHLLDLGHRTVHHISAPDSWLDARERVAGWREALRSAGAPEPDMMRRDWSARTGYEFGLKLTADPDVTAVLCGNDAIALGFLRAAAERQRRVPEDISVVGFDDIPEAGYYWPPLTTVRQDFGTLGTRALRALMDLIAHGHAQPAPLLEPELIVRSSSGPPPERRHRAPVWPAPR